MQRNAEGLVIATEKARKSAIMEQKARAAAGKALIGFLALMVALTLGSNTLQEMSVPLVTTASLQRGALERTTNVDGQLTAAKNVPVFCDYAVRVSEVYVKAGASVQAGDPLFALDLDALKAQYATDEIALDKAKNDRDKTELSAAAPVSTNSVDDAQKSLSRAEENRATNIQNQQIALDKAQSDYDKAVSDLQSAQSEYDKAVYDAWNTYITGKYTALTTAQENLTAKQRTVSANLMDAQNTIADNQRKLDAAQQAVNSAQAALQANADPAQTATLQATLTSKQAALAQAQQDVSLGNLKAQNTIATNNEDLAKAQKTYNDAVQAYNEAMARSQTATEAVEGTVASKLSAVKTAQSTLETRRASVESAQRSLDTQTRDANRTVEDARTTLSRAQETLKTNRETAEVTSGANALTIATSDLDIDKKQTNLDKLKAAVDAGGVVSAPVNGDVLSVSVTAGNNAGTAQASVTLSNETDGLELRVTVSEDQAGDMAVGDQADIIVGGSMVRAAIESIASSTAQAGRYEVLFRLDGSVGTVGQTASMRFRKRTQNYDVLVPLTALHQDNDGYFVYVVQQESGALGARMSVARADVTILEQDATRAAVQGGVTQRDTIVARSDRDLADGDRVRVEAD